MSKGRSRTWLWIGLILSGFLIAGIGLAAVVSSWTSTAYGHAFSAGFRSALFGGGGRGSKEVRKAGHCQTASVLASEDVIASDGGLDLDFVICVLPMSGGTVPDCDDLAMTYVDAAKPTRKFMVEVKRIGGGGLVCQAAYAADGSVTKRFGGGR